MRWFIFLLFLFKANASNSQSLLRLQHLTTDDGLSQNSVYTIFQGRHGFMWFATGDGLNRYDGKDFIAYKSKLNAASAHLPDRNINTPIFEDRYDRLWMSSDAGVYYWDKRRLVSNLVFPGSWELLGIDDSALWGAIPRIGIYELNLRTLKYTCHYFTDKWQARKAEVIRLANGVPVPGGFWLADGKGLLYFDRRTHKDTRALIQEDIMSVNVLKDGRLLLCAKGGVYFFDPRSGKNEYVPIDVEGNEPAEWRAFVQHAQTGDVYLGAMSHGYVCKMNPATKGYELLHFQDSRVNRMTIDRSENLWIGTEGNGAFRIDIKPKKFFCYPQPTQGDRNKNILMAKSIYRDDWGKIWIGTYASGLQVYDPATQNATTISLPLPTQTKFISPIFKDSSGSIVIGLGNHIVWLDPQSYKVLNSVQLPILKSFSLEPVDIYSIIEWKANHYTAATNMGLFCIFLQGNKWQVSTPEYFRYSRLGAWTYNLTRYGRDVYQCARNGLLHYRIDNDTAFVGIDSAFHALGIRHVFKPEKSPLLWVASEQGLILYNEGRKEYKVFDESNGLPNSYVYAILPENDSSLWLSTNQGMSHISVQYGDGKLSGVRISAVTYTTKDGLQSNEFNTGAFHKCADGTMIFGGVSGINWFKPQAIKTNPYKATPMITAIFVNDTLFASDTTAYMTSIELPFSRNTISLSLSALEMTSAGENQFAYKLDGVDKDWVYTSNDKVRYSNLQPGIYTFLLRASNNDGVWNDGPLQMRIIINPPYWQQWWFRLLVLVGIASIIFAVIRYYIRRKIVLKTLELEKQQALYLERLRISKDVHDDLGSGLSKISLMAEMAQTHLNSASAENEIRHISSVSKDLIDNMRDLIWVLNPENTTLDNMVARIREYSADYLDGTSINAIFEFPDQIPQLAITREAQRNIFSTVKEAINNCVKHAEASEVRISLRLERNVLRIAVKDNGKGITKNNSKGNGLRNMRQRIEMLGGQFVISSDGGTTIDMAISFENISSGAKNTTNV